MPDAAVLVVPLVANVGGSIGDPWMAGALRCYPPHVTVEDAETGMRIYGNAGDHRLSAMAIRTFVRRLAYGSAIGFGVLVVPALCHGLYNAAVFAVAFSTCCETARSVRSNGRTIASDSIVLGWGSRVRDSIPGPSSWLD